MRNPLSYFSTLWNRKSLAAPSSDLLEALGVVQGSAAGISVTPTTALRCTPVIAATRALCDPVGTLPLRLVRKEADGSTAEVTDHPAAALLASDWNGFSSSQDVRRTVMLDALLVDVGGIALVTRVGGEAREIVRLPPGTVAVQYSPIGEPSYKLSGEAGTRELDARDVVHIRSPYSHFPHPRSPMSLCREAIALALAMEGHAARLFGRGARPAGLLSFAEAMAPEAVRKVRETWKAAHGGENSGGTAILDKGASFTPLTINSVDAQFLELRKFAVEEIARAFGVPPHMLYEMGRATWANIGEQGREFVDYSLNPWLKAWEAALARALLSPDERTTMSVEFDTDDLTLPSLADQAAAYSALIAARVANPNECRSWMSLAPYEGGDTFANPNTTIGGTPDAAPPEATP